MRKPINENIYKMQFFFHFYESQENITLELKVSYITKQDKKQIEIPLEYFSPNRDGRIYFIKTDEIDIDFSKIERKLHLYNHEKTIDLLINI